MGYMQKKLSLLLDFSRMSQSWVLQPQRFAVTIYRYKISVYTGGTGHQAYEMGSGIARYLVIPGLVSGYIGSPPFISRKKAIWRGSHNPILRGID